MKKFFTLITVALLAFAAQAEVLTVCDGPAKNDLYPVSTTEMDPGRFTQTIYPAFMLADMQGDKISQVKYYSDSKGLSFSATLELSFKIVNYESFEELDEVWPESDVVAVATATVEKGATEMVFNLNEPYEYNGGNLLIQCKIINYDNPGLYSTYFLGAEVTVGYPSYSHLGYLMYFTDEFMPKVTFTYESATTPPTPSSGEIDGHEYVDLGLPSGTLWATCNVGADTPEGYGDYFAWGETEPKDEYTWANYKWCEGSSSMLTKYYTADGKRELDPEDDAAYVNWGSSWRMPSNEQQDELRSECTWSWTQQNGVNGYLVTGPNGNTIFIPAAGYFGGHYMYGGGFYWARTLDLEGYSSYAIFMNFADSHISSGIFSRLFGNSVRPVVEINETPVQTEAPGVQTWTGVNGDHTQYVQFIEPEDNCEMQYRYKYNNGEWGEWQTYDGVIAFKEDGAYEVEGRAKAEGKEWSEATPVSFEVTPRTSVSELSGDKGVAKVRYFNAAGQEMARPNGLTIMVITYTDGTTTTVKVVK